MTHELKIYKKYLDAILNGEKMFEIRKDDRGFRVGDILLLKEWDNIKYSGRELKVLITYILYDNFIGISPGYVALGIKILN